MARCVDVVAAAVVTESAPGDPKSLKMSGGAAGAGAGAADWADYFQMGACVRCEQLSMRPRRAMIACFACERALCFEHLCQRETTAAGPEYYCQGCFADRVWLAAASQGTSLGPAAVSTATTATTVASIIMDVDTTPSAFSQAPAPRTSTPPDVGMSD
jgi:hypothetical protein